MYLPQMVPLLHRYRNQLLITNQGLVFLASTDFTRGNFKGKLSREKLQPEYDFPPECNDKVFYAKFLTNSSLKRNKVSLVEGEVLNVT